MSYSVSNRSHGGGPLHSVFTAQRYASDITYFSSHYARDIYGSGGSTYFWTMRDIIGDFWPMTGAVSMRFVATDAAAHTWAASPAFPMQPTRQDWDQNQCGEWSGPWGTGWHCQAWRGFYAGTSGVQNGTTL
jgi:hypothetical protein